MKTLDPDYLAPIKVSKIAESSDDFSWTCVRVEFRFHLGDPYCLHLCLHAVVLVSLVKARLYLPPDGGPVTARGMSWYIPCIWVQSHPWRTVMFDTPIPCSRINCLHNHGNIFQGCTPPLQKYRKMASFSWAERSRKVVRVWVSVACQPVTRKSNIS